MNKIKAILLIIIIFLPLILFKPANNIPIKNGTLKLQPAEKTKDNKKVARFERIGEEIIYDVKMGKITLGHAKFTQIKNIQINGKLLNVMVFETNLPRFSDTETIYTDPQTLLPVKVERSISNWFVREKIIEEYNQLEYTVSINKKRNGKEQNSVIKKTSPIHNAILLPHYVRRIEKLNPGKILTANLPNRNYEINLINTEEITVPAGKFKAYHFASTPKQIEIWISADDRRIPLKIQSTTTFGYLLTLSKYNYQAENHIVATP